MKPQYYSWSVGASPLTVHLSPDVIDRLREAAATSETEELGGILLGHRESDEQITITDFELVPSEHRRGPTYTLSPADQKRLEHRLSAPRRSLETLGSFRTHLRQGLYMDQYDHDLMSSHFAATTDVMLLFRPSDWQAGFFVWEEGDIHRQHSYLEFPFDPTALPLVIEPSTIEPANTPFEKANARYARLSPFPTMAKVMLIAATFGLVAVLGHFVYQNHSANSITLASRPQPVPPLPPPPVPQVQANPPVDPDATPAPPDEYELHVKLPPGKPSPFRRHTQPHSVAPDQRNKLAKIEANAPPPSLPPLQSAANLPPAVTPPTLKPAQPTLISLVSLEPTQPGLLSRGINHVPVLNLLQRRTYKAGEHFSPARPVREVKPRISSAWQMKSDTPSLVDVKVWIDKTGQVTKTELLSDDPEPDMAELASNAAYKWTFEPARLADHPVSSEMVLHFRFVPKPTY